MKNLLVLMILGLSYVAVGQNLVPNPSFEDYSLCPVGEGEISESQGWSTYSLTPDYYNSCSVGTDVAVPSNWAGFQIPASGEAYAGFGTYFSQSWGVTDIREYVGRSLSSPMSVGTKYYVSFRVSLSLSDIIQANCASNNIGVLFSTVPYSFSNPAPINNDPHINHNGIVNDTVGWTQVFGSFIADSAYSHVAIGNFFNDSNTDTLIMDGDVNCNFSYYFLDDVCVGTDSSFVFNYDYTSGLTESEFSSSFSIYPNPATNQINIESSLSNSSFNIEMYDAQGRLIHSEKNITHTKTININSFDNGLIHIKIERDDGIYYYKFSKH
ncbi:MAG: T9SS type A sorting domain-containing protein [Crocinitomicaceae bacterium]|nr:T9SS type A sorting domain-containing protein [Crocinitomicaceae bacterium]